MIQYSSIAKLLKGEEVWNRNASILVSLLVKVLSDQNDIIGIGSFGSVSVTTEDDKHKIFQENFAS